MLILAVDSTGSAASCALLEDGVLLGEHYLNIGYTHSETLLPLIETLLSGARRRVDQLDRIAVTVGPGSFTGVRIGVSTVKGIAFPKEIPCVPVSALAAMARICPPREGILCPVMDARRAQVYNALFCWESGTLKRLTEDRALPASVLRDELEALRLPVWLTGDGTTLCASVMDGLPISVAPEHQRYQRALGAALLALSGEPVGAQELHPLYLRKPQAERERLERGEVAFAPEAKDVIL
ncbi:MAG: tRNA (adenosine(37)-N6)-threonylcarbamoyltransferase complex dimerization subunit type 1 TsaB, partial [Clostridia bacterium]|nr:tRNA (adenosine(37)-N6)-threonylcarbamoyltransferase complex dimerization subunit type 1 TsaB [Clostridia bacterium]MBQ6000696.1 tRNA (adenosine(37)-N6)-threonylcarbamoyltransferase complex dimerization subunit type 1 TsaB [Clostridia bacterium]